MSRCSHCGFAAYGRYCAACGTPIESRPELQGSAEPEPRRSRFAQFARGRAFSQLYGLDPRIAILTLVVDAMLFGGDFVTAGLIWPFSVAAGAVLGVIAYRAQMRWYGDDRDSAMIKGLILALLTAIPTPLPAILYIPSGIVGAFRMLQRGHRPGHQ